MSERLIIDGNAVYEIDEDCLRQQEARKQGCGGPRRGRREWQFGQNTAEKQDTKEI